MKYIIAYDLGTGGTKASLFNELGVSVASSFISCKTHFGDEGIHEQNPNDWWENVKISTKNMLNQSQAEVKDIKALAVSGHSLGVVPIGFDGELLTDRVPIWSDNRAKKQSDNFFTKINYDNWYLETGNGFPPELYSLFKIMWYKENKTEMYNNTQSFIGTKDYINYKMTGILCSDRSYASGSGIYSLNKEMYVDDYINASGIDKEKLPEIFPSTHIVGTIKKDIARELGLDENTKVCAGGVDNACMALGATCIDAGQAYTSLGTSSWIAVCDTKPIVNVNTHPYVFAHCLEGKYVSATAIFSAGNSFAWVKDVLCAEIESYKKMDKLAETSPIGANKLIFNPSLAGGSGLDKSVNIKGCFTGLSLNHTKPDIIRASLEGICLNLKIALDVLSEYTNIGEEILIVGGGGKSEFWRSLFADIFNKKIIKSNIGEDAGSLGAAIVAGVGVGIWEDFSVVKNFHTEKEVINPIKENIAKYECLLDVFKEIAELQSDIGDLLKNLEI